MDGRMDGQIDEWVDNQWMDGLTNRWMEGRKKAKPIDGWIGGR